MIIRLVSKLCFGWILDLLKEAKTVLTRSAVILPKVNRFGWNLKHSHYNLLSSLWADCCGLVLADSGRDSDEKRYARGRGTQSSSLARHTVIITDCFWKQRLLNKSSNTKTRYLLVSHVTICCRYDVIVVIIIRRYADEACIIVIVNIARPTWLQRRSAPATPLNVWPNSNKLNVRVCTLINDTSQNSLV